MKYLLLLTIIFGIFWQALSEVDHDRKSQMKKFREDMRQCMENYEIPDEVFKNHEPITDDKNCFFHCLYQKRGLMDLDGNIDLEKFKEYDPYMPPEIIKMHEKCSEESVETEVCDKAKEIADCVKTEFENARENHMKGTKECLAEFELPEDTLRKHIPIPDDKICFYKCVAVKAGKMDENGQFTIDEFKEKHSMAPEWMIKNLRKCSEVSQKEDPCESAKALRDCMYNKHQTWREKHNSRK